MALWWRLPAVWAWQGFKKDRIHTSGGRRRRPGLGEGQGRRIYIYMYYIIPLRKNQATGVTLLNCEQLTKDCEAFVSNRSRPSSSSFAASAHMPFRSVGGEFDNEAVAVTAICSTFWLLGDQAQIQQVAVTKKGHCSH